MYRGIPCGLLAVFGLLLSACTSIHSYRTPGEGIPYFLPRTLVRYTIDQSDPDLSEIEVIQVPDKSRPRYLSYRESGFADENLCVDRSETGLLKKVYFGAHDRTPDILLNVIELVASSARGLDERVGVPAEVSKSRCADVVISEWMDPYDQVALDRLNQKLCHLKIDAPSSVDFSTFSNECPEDSICFATKSNYEAYLSDRSGKTVKTFNQTNVVSRRDVGWIRVKGAFFNKRITQLDFTDGVLTTMRVKKDSEFLGLSQFPLQAIERVLAVPGNAIGMAFAGYGERLLYLQRRKELKAAGASPASPEAPGAGIKATEVACKPS